MIFYFIHLAIGDGWKMRLWRLWRKSIRSQQKVQAIFSQAYVDVFDVGEKEANAGKSTCRPLSMSNSSASTTASASDHPFEQIAPPLERTEVRAVEGALNLKTMCALDVYTPIRTVAPLWSKGERPLCDERNIDDEAAHYDRLGLGWWKNSL